MTSITNATIIKWLDTISMNNFLTTDDLLSGNTVHLILKKYLPQYKN